MKTLKFAFLLYLVIVLPEETSAAFQDDFKPDVEKALQWFPANTETIMVSKGFTLEPPDYSEDAPPPILETLQRFLALGALSIRDGAALPFFNDLEIRSMVKGARNFREPKGFGLMLFEGATLFFLNEGQKEKKETAFAELAGQASSVLTIEGERVLRFEETFEEDQWSFLLAWPRDEVLVIATHEGFLSQILANLAKTSGQSPLKSDLPEWPYVEEEAALWGLRHYSHDESDKDPSSPFNKAQGEAMDAGAVGFVVNVSPSSDTHYVYLTRNLEVTEEMRNRIPGEPRSFNQEPEEEAEPIKIESSVEAGPDGIHALKRYFPADMDPYDMGSADVEILWFLGFGLHL